MGEVDKASEFVSKSGQNENQELTNENNTPKEASTSHFWATASSTVSHISSSVPENEESAFDFNDVDEMCETVDEAVAQESWMSVNLCLRQIFGSSSAPKRPPTLQEIEAISLRQKSMANETDASMFHTLWGRLKDFLPSQDIDESAFATEDIQADLLTLPSEVIDVDSNVDISSELGIIEDDSSMSKDYPHSFLPDSAGMKIYLCNNENGHIPETVIQDEKVQIDSLSTLYLLDPNKVKNEKELCVVLNIAGRDTPLSTFHFKGEVPNGFDELQNGRKIPKRIELIDFTDTQSLVYRWLRLHAVVIKAINADEKSFGTRVYYANVGWSHWELENEVKTLKHEMVIITLFRSRCTRHVLAATIGHIKSDMVFILEGNDLLSFLRCGWCAREAEVDITHWQALEAQFLREQELIYDPLEQVPIDVVNTSMKTPTPNFEEFTERWEVSKGTRKTTKEINELTTKRKRIANERIQKLEKEKKEKKEQERKEQERKDAEKARLATEKKEAKKEQLAAERKKATQLAAGKKEARKEQLATERKEAAQLAKEAKLAKEADQSRGVETSLQQFLHQGMASMRNDMMSEMRSEMRKSSKSGELSPLPHKRRRDDEIPPPDGAGLENFYSANLQQVREIGILAHQKVLQNFSVEEDLIQAGRLRRIADEDRRMDQESRRLDLEERKTRFANNEVERFAQAAHNRRMVEICVNNGTSLPPGVALTSEQQLRIIQEKKELKFLELQLLKENQKSNNSD